MKKAAGFTLAEMLVTSAVLGIILVISMRLLRSTSGLYLHENFQKEILEEGREIVDYFLKDVRLARGLARQTPEHSLDPQTLILLLPSTSEKGEPLVGSSDIVIYVFDPIDNRFERIVQPDISSSRKASRALLTKNAKEVSFIWDESLPLEMQSLVSLQFTLFSQPSRGGYVRTFRSAGAFRNALSL